MCTRPGELEDRKNSKRKERSNRMILHSYQDERKSSLLSPVFLKNSSLDRYFFSQGARIPLLDSSILRKVWLRNFTRFAGDVLSWSAGYAGTNNRVFPGETKRNFREEGLSVAYELEATNATSRKSNRNSTNRSRSYHNVCPRVAFMLVHRRNG